MIEWTFFHKLLGIPEHLTEPTHYHLLGIAPHLCTPELVAKSLDERRALLRRSVPGPRFIPLVLKFEKEVLEPAAETLASLQKRSAYNDDLRRIIHERKKLAKAWLARKHTIELARGAIREALNPDGTLEKGQRTLLSVRLEELGVPPDQVAAVLANIPQPEPNEPEPSEAGQLPTSEQETDVFPAIEDEPPVAASRDESVSNTASPAEPAVAVASDQDEASPPRPVASAMEDVCVVLDSIEFIPRPRPHRHLRVLKRVLMVTTPIAALLCFALFLRCLDRTVQQVADRFNARMRAPILSSPSPVTSRDPTPQAVTEPPPAGDTLVHEGADQPSLPAEPSSVREGHSRDDSAGKAPVPALKLRTETSDLVRARYSTDGAPVSLLTDVALTVRAIRMQASDMAARSSRSGEALDQLVRQTDLLAEITRSIPAVEPVGLPGWLINNPKAREAELKSMLGLRSKARMFRAIDRLVLRGDPISAEILMRLLWERIRLQDAGTCCRILGALAAMPGEEIPGGLVQMLPASQPPVAYAITRTLMEQSDLLPQADGPARLPFENTPNQRQESARWWKERYSGGGLKWKGGQSGQAVIWLQAKQGGADDYDARPDRLAAAMAVDAMRMAAMLEGSEWKEDRWMLKAVKAKPSRDDGPPEWLSAMDAVVDQIGRLVREHPQADLYAVRVEVIATQRRVRLRLSDTTLQKIVVDFDAAADLLDVLIRELSDGQFDAALAEVRQRHRSAAAHATDVLQEMRDSAYYTLLLWEQLKPSASERAEN